MAARLSQDHKPIAKLQSRRKNRACVCRHARDASRRPEEAQRGAVGGAAAAREERGHGQGRDDDRADSGHPLQPLEPALRGRAVRQPVRPHAQRQQGRLRRDARRAHVHRPRGQLGGARRPGQKSDHLWIRPLLLHAAKRREQVQDTVRLGREQSWRLQALLLLRLAAHRGAVDLVRAMRFQPHSSNPTGPESFSLVCAGGSTSGPASCTRPWCL